MKALIIAAVLLVSSAGTVAGTTAGHRAPVVCGGFPLAYGTFIGVVGSRSGGMRRASSVMAVAAVTTHDDFRARAWMVWDERGLGWLAIAKGSPADLKRLWIFSPAPNFASGKGLQVRFTALRNPLPSKYRLTDCPDALPHGE